MYSAAFLCISHLHFFICSKATSLFSLPCLQSTGSAGVLVCLAFRLISYFSSCDWVCIFLSAEWSWVVLFKFERRIAIIKVTGQCNPNLYCLKMLWQGSRGSTASSWPPVAQTLLQLELSFLSRMVQGVQVGLTLSWWVRGQRTRMKGKTSSRVVSVAEFLFSPWAVCFRTT